MRCGAPRASETIMSLVEQLSAYSQWRSSAASAVGRLRHWLSRNEIGDVQGDLRLQYLLDRLRDDKLTVAFVAEFSRGKSELINAIFFSGTNSRISRSGVSRCLIAASKVGAGYGLMIAPMAG